MDPDPRAARRPSGPVVSVVGLLRAGQLQGQRVAYLLAGGRGELGGNDDLVGATRVEQPSGQDDRPLDGPGHLVVGQREPGAGRGVALGLVPEHDRELGQRGDFRQGRDLGPVEPGLVGQHRGGRGQRAGPEPVERGLAAARASDGGQDRRGGQGDEQGQDGQRPPALEPVQAQPGQRDQHLRLPLPAHAAMNPPASMLLSRRPDGARRQGCGDDRLTVATPTQGGVVAPRDGRWPPVAGRRSRAPRR